MPQKEFRIILRGRFLGDPSDHRERSMNEISLLVEQALAKAGFISDVEDIFDSDFELSSEEDNQNAL
jgi:hypothetical protein